MARRNRDDDGDIPSDDPDDGSEFMKSRRKCKRWLHAGVARDPKGGIVQMWFGFSHFLHEDAYTQAPIDQRGWKIHWAVNSKGELSGSRGVGQIQRNLITFNPHISRHWKKHLAKNGQWKYKKATKGRTCQYNTLRKFWKSQTYVDPYPNGNRNLLVGPSLNVIHPRGGVNDEPPYHEISIDAPCYPDSRIPLNPRLIKFNLFEDWNARAITVVEDFLRGKMASDPGNFPGFDAVQADRIESAFFHCGWRVDLRAVRKANKHVTLKVVKLANNSRSWRRHPPVRVDDHQKYCQRVQDLMDRLRDNHHEAHGYNGDDSSDDDDDDDAPGRGPGGRPPNGGPNDVPNDCQDDNDIDSDDSDNEDNGAPVSGPSRSRISQARKGKAATGKGAKRSGARKKRPQKFKKTAKGKGKGKARQKQSKKVVVDLSSDSEEEPKDDQVLNENDDDDGYAVILEDSSDADVDNDEEDANEDEPGEDRNSETALASALLNHLQNGSPQRDALARVQPRDDEPLFVSSDDDDDELILVEVCSIPAVRSRLGGSCVNGLREAYLANTRIKQERSPPAREPLDQSERECRTPSAVIKTSNSTPRHGSPTAGARDERRPSEGSSSGYMDAIHAIGDMLLNDLPSTSATPERPSEMQARVDCQPQPESQPLVRPCRAASAEPSASQRDLSQMEASSAPAEPQNPNSKIRSFASQLTRDREFAFSPRSPIPGSGPRQPSGMDSSFARKRISEDIEDAQESPSKKAKEEPEFIWIKDESESQMNPIEISDDEDSDGDDGDINEFEVVIIGDGSEDDPILID